MMKDLIAYAAMLTFGVLFYGLICTVPYAGIVSLVIFACAVWVSS